MIPCLRPHLQLNIKDCAIAALASYLGKSYEEVSRAAVSRFPKAHTRGLYLTEIRRLAGVFGVRLRKVEWTGEETGVLVLPDHVAVVFQGVLIDPADGLVWDAETYIKGRKVTVLI